jgi:prepilin-type N-terminal cleavage/methylation domain-containing protein
VSERTRPRCRQGNRAVLRTRAKRSVDREGGFTLIELLIVVAVTPLIVGALGIGLVTMFSLQNGTTGRLQDSSDAQVVTSTFIKDVQSATLITTSSTATPQCGSGTQLLGLQWGSGQVVSYTDVSQGSGTYSLDRSYCVTSTSAADTTIVSYDMKAPCVGVANSTCQSPPVAYDGTTVVATSSGYVTTVGISSVSFPITEPKSSYTYTLAASPAPGPSTSTSGLGGPTSGPTCGFALPDTGTYSSTLCFVGFTTQIIQNAEGVTAANSGSDCTAPTYGTNVSVAIPGGYTMSFCLTVINNGNSVQAEPFPTWPGAFLGNDVNGTPFYTGVGCPDTDPTTVIENNIVEGTTSCINPAIYQETGGAFDTVTASNIVVTAPGGADATNYEVVTTDAETTDPGESLTWTSTLPASSPLPFTQVPDTTTSPEGDACNETSLSGSAGQAVSNGLGLTGIGTDQVECQSNWQSGGAGSGSDPRTGTALLELSPTTTNGVTYPVTITAQMQGAGYEGVAFGLLLP